MDFSNDIEQNFANISQINQPSKPQMLKAGVIWLISTDGSGDNELASCVRSRRSMPINQMTLVSVLKFEKKLESLCRKATIAPLFF